MTRLSVLFVAALVLGTAAASYRRVCYYTNWAQYRNGPAKFFPENVDPSLCTHIIYSFAKMVGNHLAAYEWNDESTPWMKGMYERFQAAKTQNPSVKTLIAVGGWNMASPPFTKMVATDAGINEFASTAVTFLRKHGFDGLDIDWEYPANRGSPAGDKQRYVKLLTTLHNVFASETVPAGKTPLMLSAAVPAGKDKIDSGFDVPAISKVLDMINLMTYDLHGSWEDHTGHNSPLHASSKETGNDTFLNIDWVTHYWVSKGAPKSMINVGMGLYGRSFKLPYGHTNSDMGCPASGAGPAGQYTSEAGFISYYEVCAKLKGGAQRKWEPEQKVPYLVDGELWVGYDDKESLKYKVDYVKQEGYGGIMVWALDLDDFSGSCGEGKYPLMHSIVSELNAAGGSSPQVTTHAPVTAAPTNPPVVTNAPIWTNPPVVTNAPIVTNPPVVVTTQAPLPTTKSPEPTTTAAPVTTKAPMMSTTTQSSATAGQGGTHHDLTLVPHSEFDCSIKPDGYYANPITCSSYYICAAQMTFKTDCHPGLLFNTATLYCDFPDHVNCQANSNQPNTQAPQTAVKVTTQSPIVTNAPWTQAPTTKAPIVTQAPITNAPQVPVQPANFCIGKSDGFYPDPTSCEHFYQCSFEKSYHEPCPGGTYFSQPIKGCDWAANVPNCP